MDQLQVELGQGRLVLRNQLLSPAYLNEQLVRPPNQGRRPAAWPQGRPAVQRPETGQPAGGPASGPASHTQAP